MEMLQYGWVSVCLRNYAETVERQLKNLFRKEMISLRISGVSW